MKISCKNVDCYLSVKIKCGFREHIEQDILEVFSKKGVPFFLKAVNWKSKKALFSGIRAVSL